MSASPFDWIDCIITPFCFLPFPSYCEFLDGGCGGNGAPGVATVSYWVGQSNPPTAWTNPENETCPDALVNTKAPSVHPTMAPVPQTQSPSLRPTTRPSTSPTTFPTFSVPSISDDRVVPVIKGSVCGPQVTYPSIPSTHPCMHAIANTAHSLLSILLPPTSGLPHRTTTLPCQGTKEGQSCGCRPYRRPPVDFVDTRDLLERLYCSAGRPLDVCVQYLLQRNNGSAGKNRIGLI